MEKRKNKFYVQVDTYDGHTKRIFEYDGLDVDEGEDEIRTDLQIELIDIDSFLFGIYKLYTFKIIDPSKGTVKIECKFAGPGSDIRKNLNAELREQTESFLIEAYYNNSESKLKYRGVEITKPELNGKVTSEDN